MSARNTAVRGDECSAAAVRLRSWTIAGGAAASAGDSGGSGVDGRARDSVMLFFAFFV